MAEEQKQEEIAFNGAGTEGHVMAPKGRQEKTCFVTFAQSRRGVVHWNKTLMEIINTYHELFYSQIL